jgi:pseudouridine-5'-phosphate glycosidase
VEQHDVTADLTLAQELTGGTSPAGATITVKVTPAGFFHTGGIGGAGQSAEPLSAAHVARMLEESFGAEALRAVLAHLVRLNEAL